MTLAEKRGARGSSRTQGWTKTRLLGAAARLVLGRGHSERNKYFSFSFFSAKRIGNYFTSLLNTCSYQITTQTNAGSAFSISLIICNICGWIQSPTNRPHDFQKDDKIILINSSPKISQNQWIQIPWRHPWSLNPFCSCTPRSNFSSTFYPQSSWCIIQVIHSL
jgi:hypothetical protein